MDRKKAVVIEQDAATARDISDVISGRDYEVKRAANGLDGIELICEELPDLILLNPAVTDINGFCVYKLLKDDPRTSDIPLLICITNEKEAYRFWGIKPQRGQNAIKFINKADFEANVGKAIEEIERRVNSNKFHSQSEQFKKLLARLVETYQSCQNLHSEQARVILGDVLEKITNMLSSEVGSLMLVDDESQELTIKASRGLSDDIIGKTRIKVGRGISGWVAKSGSPLLIKNVESDERFSRQNSGRYYNPSLLSAPIRVKDKIVGVINVNNKTTREQFSEYDLSLLTILVNEIAIAIESSHWQKELEEANERIEKLKTGKKIFADIARSLDDELYELTISQEVSNIIYARLDYKEIIDAILEIIERSIDCHLCGLLFVDEAMKTGIIVEVKYPASQKEVDAFKLRIIETFNRLTGGRLLPEQVSVDQANNNNLTDSFSENRNILSSFQAHLLTAGDRPIGMLAVTNSFPNAFSGEDLRIFSIISRHSSIAINNTLLHKKITELSITDGLTGLYVYRYFNDAMDKEILRSARYRQPFGLIMMDLDGFKKINDTYGHPQGDEVLREIAQILKKICREVDVVARYGGEEFAVILPETDLEGAFILADRIRMVIKNYAFGNKDTVINLTASFGVASYPDIALAKSDLIKCVDKALYRAKAEGRNKTVRAIKEISNEIQ
ncbi:MAG: diguanylate cyclase [Candidatus Omnitrophota bacterium]